ncbi:AMP-binding enzyme [Pseudomonas mandelii]|uniref:AMP-binding enzyme n=1 Tax=Pseudomonas mandelii TaxID=75612 RepID=UPI003C776A2D
MIITAGFNIYPAELERVIAEHPSVSMVAVGGINDDLKGELAKAYVVRRKGAALSAEELIEFCRSRLAAYKIPRAVQFVDDLPKTSSGKIMRRKLIDL